MGGISLSIFSSAYFLLVCGMFKIYYFSRILLIEKQFPQLLAWILLPSTKKPPPDKFSL